MQRFDCLEPFTHMVRELYDDMLAHITDNSTIYEEFTVTNGVEHGCVLATTIFSHMLSAMLMDTYRDERPQIRIA
ncbi:hypothetical protein SprV_0100222500 [Sparganum proliferum]